jgi:hypothetical protein
MQMHIRPKEKIMAKGGTLAKVTQLPDCDLCKHLPMDEDSVLPPRKAEYDFKTQDGRWANGCKPHYLRFRLYLDLGTGKGQKLEVG